MTRLESAFKINNSNGVARARLACGEAEAAAEVVRPAVDVMHECGYRLGEAGALTALAHASEEIGDSAAAAEYRVRADEILRTLGLDCVPDERPIPPRGL